MTVNVAECCSVPATRSRMARCRSSVTPSAASSGTNVAYVCRVTSAPSTTAASVTVTVCSVWADAVARAARTVTRQRRTRAWEDVVRMEIPSGELNGCSCGTGTYHDALVAAQPSAEAWV